jgi:signal transduction histidine kinase
MPSHRWSIGPGFGARPWVEEVWANYITNAIYYGGRQPRLEIGADVMENLVDLPVIVDEDEDKDILVPTTMIRFWVRDNGDGIPPERQAEVFAPFGARKLAASENPQPANALNAHGHGLGPSIVAISSRN